MEYIFAVIPLLSRTESVTDDLPVTSNPVKCSLDLPPAMSNTSAWLKRKTESQDHSIFILCDTFLGCMETKDLSVQRQKSLMSFRGKVNLF